MKNSDELIRTVCQHVLNTLNMHRCNDYTLQVYLNWITTGQEYEPKPYLTWVVEHITDKLPHEKRKTAVKAYNMALKNITSLLAQI